MPDIFRVDVVSDEGVAVLRFIGELDIQGASVAEKAGIDALSSLNGNGSRLVIDVAELAFCDSSGLHALITICQSAESEGHKVALRSPSPMLRRILDLTDTSGLFIFEA